MQGVDNSYTRNQYTGKFTRSILSYSSYLTPLLVEFDKLQKLLGNFSPVMSLIDKDIKGKGLIYA